MIDFIKDFDDSILTADGFDDALVGVVEKFGQPAIACYDKSKCIEILAKDMSYEDAIEYFYFNVIGSYVGEYTPCFLNMPDIKKPPIHTEGFSKDLTPTN